LESDPMMPLFGKTNEVWEKRNKEWRKAFAFLPTVIDRHNGETTYCWLEFYEQRLIEAFYSIDGNYEGGWWERRSIAVQKVYLYRFYG
jgi:hypothetical protein